ncbi:putative RNA polymerase sigma-H factor [Candidatus Promineifilum breve]|uniref:RNA polymerase sigma-H factor n=1 Tax=Candidatus Promineifilum breve TaxID=1806508 RepID=A0A160T7A4_9CHLR|nr:putative RNA polymerase sigma-H factor [Candidatus Promineifilum breve]
MASVITKPTPYPDEAALVEQAKSDPAAFGVLYDRYVDRIYGYALRETRDVAAAQDVTAATFEKALRHLRRFRWDQMGLAPWLYRIARNEIVQQYRRDKRLSPLITGDDDTSERSAGPHLWEARPIESAVLSGERDRALHDALGRLSAADRELLTLRFLEQLSTEDVAHILDCSRDNVYVRLHRALGRLREQLGAHEVK